MIFNICIMDSWHFRFHTITSQHSFGFRAHELEVSEVSVFWFLPQLGEDKNLERDKHSQRIGWNLKSALLKGKSAAEALCRSRFYVSFQESWIIFHNWWRNPAIFCLNMANTCNSQHLQVQSIPTAGFCFSFLCHCVGFPNQNRNQLSPCQSGTTARLEAQNWRQAFTHNISMFVDIDNVHNVSWFTILTILGPRTGGFFNPLCPKDQQILEKIQPEGGKREKHRACCGLHGAFFHGYNQ